MGVHRNVSANVRPALNETSGLNPPGKRSRLGAGGRGVTRQIPDLSGDAGAAGRGVHASGVQNKMPRIGGRDWGMNSEVGLENKGGLYEWFYALADRLRRVRVCCGDWQRILGSAPTTCIGTTGVFLDPPYAVKERSDVYNEESRELSQKVREWAITNGENPELRIALCGYEGEHDMPGTWEVVRWKANGGFANQKREGTRGKQNAHRERIWFSPHCIRTRSLFCELLSSGEVGLSQLQGRTDESVGPKQKEQAHFTTLMGTAMQDADEAAEEYLEQQDLIHQGSIPSRRAGGD
jgi:hypothetical protein